MNRITFAPIFVEIQEKNYLICKNASAILAFIRIEIITDFFIIIVSHLLLYSNRADKKFAYIDVDNFFYISLFWQHFLSLWINFKCTSEARWHIIIFFEILLAMCSAWESKNTNLESAGWSPRKVSNPTITFEKL